MKNMISIYAYLKLLTRGYENIIMECWLMNIHEQCTKNYLESFWNILHTMVAGRRFNLAFGLCM